MSSEARSALDQPYAALRASIEAWHCCEDNRPTEAQIQALWFDKTLRPQHLALPDGTPLTVLEPGKWNHADGPDFKDALLSFGGYLRKGDVEIHLTPRDWDTHHHAGDPNYNNLILHVVWSPQPTAKTLPPHIPTLVLQSFAENQAPYPFHSLHPEGYPYADLTHRPCRVALDNTPGKRERLLLSAGHFRLRVKTKTLRDAIAAEGLEQPLYAGILTAMGYGRNAPLFTRLAREIPYARLVDLTPIERFALLAGIAGLLKPEQRGLWDIYWHLGAAPTLESYHWDTRGLRPQNHPYRRLAGAIGLLQATHTLLTEPFKRFPQKASEASRFLNEELRLTGSPIGESRAAALLINLFIPYRLATNTLSEETLRELPPEHISAPMRDTWLRLTGDATRPLPSDGLRLQGLLQLHADFCANPTLTCAHCPLANASCKNDA